MTVYFYSEVFDKEFTPQNVDELNLKDLYLLADELYVSKLELDKKWKSIPKREYHLQSELIQQSKRIDLFYIIVKRKIHYLGKSQIAQLHTAVKSWKRRAYKLGDCLNMTKVDVQKMRIPN